MSYKCKQRVWVIFSFYHPTLIILLSLPFSVSFFLSGVRHSNIICDSCKKHGIMGMRWKCKVCFDYDLCTQCYMNNKHDLTHAFERYETAHSQPWVPHTHTHSLTLSHSHTTNTQKPIEIIRYSLVVYHMLYGLSITIEVLMLLLHLLECSQLLLYILQYHSCQCITFMANNVTKPTVIEIA